MYTDFFYAILRVKQLPSPVKMCPKCCGTIYTKGHKFQCPTCGTKLTTWGGPHKYTDSKGRPLRASKKWKQLCAETEAVRVKVLGGIARERCETCARVRNESLTSRNTKR